MTRRVSGKGRRFNKNGPKSNGLNYHSDMDLQLERAWKVNVRKWMGLALLFHLFAAFFSLGHYSVDEHFQILEFLNFKRGGTPQSVLPIEYVERMRSWFQPFLYLKITEALELVGLKSPFHWAIAIRGFTAFVGWLSTLALLSRAAHWVHSERAQRIFLYSSACLWFLPALHARPSSESLSASLMVLTLALADQLSQRRDYVPNLPRFLRRFETPFLSWALVGLLAGVSFEVRFQMGFAILGLWAWLLWIARIDRKSLVFMVLGFWVAIALGRWIDRWGYGEWVFSPWNYVDFNLVRGEVNKYHTSPWWEIFRVSVTEAWPLLGVGVLGSVFVTWVLKPKHILTWVWVPFFLIHEFIAHKELRFFFPLVASAPAFLAICADRFSRVQLGKLTRGLWKILKLNNGIALVALTFLPAARPIQFYQGIDPWVSAIAPQSFVLHYTGEDPYVLVGLPVYFYRRENVKTQRLSRLNDLVGQLQSSHRDQPLWLFWPKLSLPEEETVLRQRCERVYETLPRWVALINPTNWVSRAAFWSLWRCQ